MPKVKRKLSTADTAKLQRKKKAPRQSDGSWVAEFIPTVEVLNSLLDKKEPSLDPSNPRLPSFAEKQLKEQNRQLREELNELHIKLELALRPPDVVEASPYKSPAPLSKEWEHKMQEREMGKLEGRADAYASVIDDFFELVGVSLGTRGER